MTSLNDIAFALIGYLAGSIPFGLILTRAAGLGDVRSIGSGNIGATNVLRTGNKGIAALTLLCDGLKGFFPVLAATHYGDVMAPFAAGFGALAGHILPVWLKFKGGKGVATALGVLVGFSGWLGLLILACWVLVAAVWRYSSLSSLVAAVMAPMLYILLGGDLWEFNKWIFLATLAMSALLAYRHKLNIQRLLEGKESKLGQKKSK